MWLVLIWVISIVLNTVMIVRGMMLDRSRVTGLYLFYYAVFGTIFAPILALLISMGLVISLHHKLKKMEALNRTLYRFGSRKDDKDE
jgi:uncharacterized membrane protein